MADLFQGIAPPDVNTTKAQTTTAPSWYTDYLSGLSTAGQQAVQQGGVAGFSPLQQQAYGLATQTAAAQQPYLQQAANLVSSGTATTPSMMGQYMNPYTQDVVNEIGRLGIRNLQETTLPSVQAAATGMGQYGSKRGLELQGQAMRDTLADIAGKQSAALQTGYSQAQQAAASDLARQLQGATTAGQLGSTASQTGLAGLSALSTLGAQQQAQEQAQLNYPMTAQTNLSALLRGYNIPTSVSETYSGPMANLQYGPSQFAQIAGLGSLAGALGSQPVVGYDSNGRPIYGQSAGSQILGGLGNIFGKVSDIFTTTPTADSTTTGSTDTSWDQVWGG